MRGLVDAFDAVKVTGRKTVKSDPNRREEVIYLLLNEHYSYFNGFNKSLFKLNLIGIGIAAWMTRMSRLC